MTINFYLDRYLTDNGEKSIICYVRGIEKQKTIYLNTKLKISPDFWNSEKQIVRRTHQNSSQINTFLEKMKSEIQQLQVSFMTNQAMEFTAFKKFVTENLFSESSSNKNNFFKVYDVFLNIIKNEMSRKSIETFVVLRKDLLALEEKFKIKLTFNSINADFQDKFLDFLQNVKKITNNTIFNKFKKLKRFMNWSFERGYHTSTAYKTLKAKEEQVDIVYLTNDELNRLYAYDFSDNAKYEQVRDVFCFSCFVGQRFSDIMGLDFNDIRENIWYLRTNKTKDLVEIPLSKRAVSIIDKYRPFKALPKYNNLIFNKYLRKIAEIAGIDEQVKRVRYRGTERIEEAKPKFEFIGSHTGRRTFVTLSLEKGVRPEIVMNVTGHKDYKTLKRYIKITSKVTREEILRAWG